MTTPKQNLTYLIEYQPDGTDKLELAYFGPGTYKGKSIKDDNGDVLYFMEDLRLEKGFTKGGWFSPEDIKAELNHG
jgi:hypothetical protein